MIATVVELDLIHYSERARRIQDELGAEGVTVLNERINTFVDKCVQQSGKKGIVKVRTGDGAILIFAKADDAHQFAVVVHEQCDADNKNKGNKETHFWFRVGCATGEVDAAGENFAGVTIIDAVRLEAAGNKAHILIDEATYKGLKHFQAKYPPRPERVIDKHGKSYSAHRFKVEVSEQRPNGVVSREEFLASKGRLSNEVFAIELLRRPVKLERNSKGHLTVTVDRNDVQEMLISNEGKMATIQRYATPDKISELLKLDREVQAYLAGDSPQLKMTIDLPKLGIPLRWASGGVLSIVTDASEKQWVPLFFRDIRPYGWNISLGTSERWFTKDGRPDPTSWDLELKEPCRYIVREFVEESLIVTGIPEQGGTLSFKTFNLRDGRIPIPDTRAKQFDDEHCRLRYEEDGLAIKEADRHKTAVGFARPKCSVQVLFDSEEKAETDEVLVCFSILDLGIEVVKVAKYRIGKNDWMLDGEIKEKHVAETGTTEKELIRMPIAMLSLKYLSEIFATGQDWHRYTFGPQPSIKVARAPDPERGEIKLFDWDVRRRMEAVDGKWGTESQKKRFLDWYDKFGEHFIKDRGLPGDDWQLSGANPSRLFVPGTAKVLNLYFSHFKGGEIT